MPNKPFTEVMQHSLLSRSDLRLLCGQQIVTIQGNNEITSDNSQSF